MTPYFGDVKADLFVRLLQSKDCTRAFEDFSKKCLAGVAVWRSVLFRALFVKSFFQMVAAMRSSSEN